MTDIASDLREKLNSALLFHLECHEVSPGGKTMEYSDEHKSAIDALTNLIDSVDAIRSSLMKTSVGFRATAPEIVRQIFGS
jgi:hypothetical protein